MKIIYLLKENKPLSKIKLINLIINKKHRLFFKNIGFKNQEVPGARLQEY